MTQVAFSHQFSNRWTNAPQKVKDALIQEFDDIVRLLDADTDLETFEFSVPDLNAYIESISVDVDANPLADRESDTPTPSQNNHETESLHSHSDESDHEDVSFSEDNLKAEVVYQSNSTDLVDTEDHGLVRESMNAEGAINEDTKGLSDISTRNTPIFGEDISAKSFEGKFDEEFIKDLESRIDDYLSEQLMTMSEDLKSWLREQINNHVEGRNTD